MKQTRHILGLSGGKDSSALAVYMRNRVPNMEYVFCDTGKELPETYEYLAKLEAFLGKRIVRLNADRGFDHWLQVYGGYALVHEAAKAQTFRKIRGGRRDRVLRGHPGR
jgi:3'-phosphoadenosine 5'-phosphosulfate sulfotransferase (PAPS reductase)/FAD synthetase